MKDIWAMAKAFIPRTFLALGLAFFDLSSVAAQDMGIVPYGAIPVPPAIWVDQSSSTTGQSGPAGDPIYFSGGEIGKSFEGLAITERDFYGEKFGDLVGQPNSPLTLQFDSGGANLWTGILDKNDKGTSFIAGVTEFGKQQVGAGSVAIRFDEPICQFGFKARVNTPLRPISGNYMRGPIGVIFYADDGSILGEFLLGKGDIYYYGFSLPAGSIPNVSGVTIENIDEGGVQIFDMKYLADCMPFLS